MFYAHFYSATKHLFTQLVADYLNVFMLQR